MTKYNKLTIESPSLQQVSENLSSGRYQPLSVVLDLQL
jgi:hypothetical protein